MKHLDMISPCETHKIGVIYIKPGQASDAHYLIITKNILNSRGVVA